MKIHLDELQTLTDESGRLVDAITKCTAIVNTCTFDIEDWRRYNEECRYDVKIHLVWDYAETTKG